MVAGWVAFSATATCAFSASAHTDVINQNALHVIRARATRTRFPMNATPDLSARVVVMLSVLVRLINCLCVCVCLLAMLRHGFAT